MRRLLLLLSMFVLFGVVHVTQDRVPRSAISVLRGGSEHVARFDRQDGAIGSTGHS